MYVYGYITNSEQIFICNVVRFFFSIETWAAVTWLVRPRAFPTAPEGIACASTHPRLLRLRVAASLLESLYHSVFWGQRHRQIMSHSVEVEPFPGSRGWGRRRSGPIWPLKPLLVATEVPSLCGLGLSLYGRRVELPRLDTAYWPNRERPQCSSVDTVRYDASSLREYKERFHTSTDLSDHRRRHHVWPKLLLDRSAQLQN